MGLHFLLDKGRVRKQAALLAKGEAVENHQHVQHGLHAARRPLFVQFTDAGSEQLGRLAGKKHAPAGLIEKLFERSHRIAVQELVIEQIRTELERYFMDFLRLAAIRKPGMGRIAAHQHQFHIPDRPHMVADYARSSRGIDYQIEFHLLVRVEGEVEAALLPRKNHETVVVGERCALAQYFHMSDF